jgi:glutamine amidotransferase
MSPSLFYGNPSTLEHQVSHKNHNLVSTIASEPFDDEEDHWVEVCESSYLQWDAGKVVVNKIQI